MNPIGVRALVRRVSIGIAGVVSLVAIEEGVVEVVARLELPPGVDGLLALVLMYSLVLVAGAGLIRVASFDVPVRISEEWELWYVMGGIAGLLVASLLAAGIGWLVGRPPAANATQAQTQGNPLFAVGLLLLVIVGTAPVEELIFRGLLQGSLTDVVPTWAAIGVGSGAWALSHFDVLVGSFVGVAIVLGKLLVSGVVLGVVYERTESLLVPILAHGLYNAAVLTPTVIASFA